VIVRSIGSVVRTLGETVIASLPRARIGDGVFIHGSAGRVAGSVASVERSRVAIAAFGSLTGIRVGDRVETSDEAQTCLLGFGALGRALDATGAAIDTRGPVDALPTPVRSAPAAAIERPPVEHPFWTGVRAIDGLLTIGCGARIGIFGAPGAGKTTLLETIVAGARADAVVLGLVGERGREAAAWLARVNARTTIVCATSDRSAAERSRAAEVAIAQAVALRDRGLHVLLVIDSLARYCSALREQRVALGEPVGRGGYPPSVFADLARLLERAGNASRGSMTLVASVLSDGADEREPLSDAARSFLDGHVLLSADLARAGHYPAIDLLASTSRTMQAVVSAQHKQDAAVVRSALALLVQTKEARRFGLVNQIDPALAKAVAFEDEIDRFTAQTGASTPAQTLAELATLAEHLR
jgi:FliI/YscN family ATPase